MSRHTALLVFCTLFLVTPAAAQWTVYRLHPPAERSSWGYAANLSLQAGSVSIGFSGPQRAAFWNGTPGSVTILHPAGATESFVYGVEAGVQYGYASFSGSNRAGLWTGSAASWTSLHPPHASASFILGAGPSEQAGGIVVNGVARAGLWRNTVGSFVDLHPSQARSSIAYDAGQGEQVGYAVHSGTGSTVASLWRGTAATHIFLGTLTRESTAYAVSNGEQVGVDRRAGQSHAALWHGTAASFADLHPLASFSSSALGAQGGQQVGWYTRTQGEGPRAAIWSGSADSIIDLANFLPPTFSQSYATAVYQDSGFTYVVGYGVTSDPTSHYESLLWIGPAPPPAVLQGVINLGDLSGDPEGNQVTFEIIQGGQIIETITEALGLNGQFSINTHRNGPTSVAVKASHWLRKVAPPIVLSIGGTSELQFSLLNGDCDGDNHISLSDYALIAAAYNSATGQENWDPRCDLNEDGSVDIADYAILSANFGIHGD